MKKYKGWSSFSVLAWVCLLGVLALVSGGLAAEPETVNLNTASVEELSKVSGITQELAKAIVQYREKAGPFKKPEDLLKVPGMTQELFKKIAPRVDAKGNVVCPKGIESEEEQETPSLAPSKC